MQYIIYEKINQIAKIIFNRPEKFNSFCREMAFEFHQALDEAKHDDDIRCVFITANGKAFCAGQDLAEAIEDNGIALEQIVSEHYNPIILRMRQLLKPIVVAVNGVAAGAGANIALAGDVVVASENATFIQAFSKIGLIPDSAGTFFLPRLIGMQQASALMMLGEKITATEAVQLGMIFRAFADETFNSDAWKIAETLASMPTVGLGLTKQLLNESYHHTLAEQLEREGQLQVKAAATYDYQEGVQAFLEKRKPVFKGQ